MGVGASIASPRRPTVALALAVLALACGDDGEPDDHDDGDAVLLEEPALALVEGRSGEVAFDVPDDAVSVLVSVVGSDELAYRLCDWRGDEVVLVPTGWEDDERNFASTRCLTCATRIESHAGVFVALAPNVRGVPLPIGGHALHVCSDFPISEPVAVRVEARRVPGGVLPETGTLDLRLHLSGARGLTAATAPDDVALQASLALVASTYAAAGIEIQTTFHDIADEFQDVEDGELTSLFRSIGADAPRGLHVFVVEHVVDLLALAGKAGGIPGPTNSGGATSGVVVALDLNGMEDVLTLDRVIAHEVGHYLGLFHTDEVLDDLGEDQFDDTDPADQTNLMHYEARGEVVSPSQAAVLRSHPLVW